MPAIKFLAPTLLPSMGSPRILPTQLLTTVLLPPHPARLPVPTTITAVRLFCFLLCLAAGGEDDGACFCPAHQSRTTTTITGATIIFISPTVRVSII